MNKMRFFLGLLASLSWLVLVLVFMIWKRAEFVQMQPHAWGDFFAGVFSPLAFMWLVLGYLQQGEELRLSTAALHLQAKELNASVNQQQALVDVARLELDAMHRAAERDHLSRQAAKFTELATEFGTTALGKSMETVGAWVVSVRPRSDTLRSSHVFAAYSRHLEELDRQALNTKDDTLEAARRTVKTWFLKCLKSRESDQLSALDFEQLVSRDRAAMLLNVAVMTRAQTEWWQIKEGRPPEKRGSTDEPDFQKLESFIKAKYALSLE